MKKRIYTITALLCALCFTSTACTTADQPAENQAEISSDESVVTDIETNELTDSPSENPETESEPGNSHGNFWSAQSDSYFHIAEEGDWLYYTYSHENITNVGSASTTLRKIPKDGDSVEDMIELYSSTDNTSIRYLQVAGHTIYWSSFEDPSYTIWSMDADGGEPTALIDSAGDDSFYVAEDGIYYVSLSIEQHSASSEDEVYAFCKWDEESGENTVLYEPEESDTSVSIEAVTADQKFYIQTNNRGEHPYYLYDGNAMTLCASVEDLRQNENGDIFYSLEGNEWYKAAADDLSSGDLIFDMTQYYESSIPFFVQDTAYYYKDYGYPAGIFSASQDTGEVQINTDHTLVDSDVTSCGDGYLYYVTPEEVLGRMNADGSEWEDASWMIQ